MISWMIGLNDVAGKNRIYIYIHLNYVYIYIPIYRTISWTMG
jgi:hypothetical protein